MPQRLRPFFSGIVIFAALSFSRSAQCRISTLPSIAALTSSSSAIIVGTVIRLIHLGSEEITSPAGQTYRLEHITAFIGVEEVLKGDISGKTIQVDYQQNSNWEPGPLTNSLDEGARRMFFLKDNGDRFVFVASDQSSMPISHSQTALSKAPADDLYSLVIQRLAEGLFAAGDKSQERIQSIFVIDNEFTPLVTGLFKSALTAPAARSDKVFRFELIAALVRHRDESVLPNLEAALLSNHDPESNNARGNMIYALQQIEPSHAGPILIQALRLPEAGMRAAATSALKRVRSDASIEALLGTLDDPDPEVQLQVIDTLSVLLSRPNCARDYTAQDGAFTACAERWREFATTWMPASN